MSGDARPAPAVIGPLASHALVEVDALGLLVGAAVEYVLLDRNRLLERRAGADLLAAIDACQRALGFEAVSSVSDAVSTADAIVASTHDGWVTAATAAARVGRTPQAITKAARAGRLSAHQASNRGWLIDPESLEQEYGCATP